MRYTVHCDIEMYPHDTLYFVQNIVQMVMNIHIYHLNILNMDHALDTLNLIDTAFPVTRVTDQLLLRTH